MATHSSIIAWRIPWTEELGGLQSMGSQTQTQLRDILVGSCQHLLMALDPECSQLSQLFPNQLCALVLLITHCQSCVNSCCWHVLALASSYSSCGILCFLSVLSSYETWNQLCCSVQSLSHVQLFATPWTAACQPSLSINNPESLLKLMSIESVMPSNHLIHCHPLLLLSSVFPSIRVFSNESVLRIRWPKYWNFSFSISPSSEYSGLIPF